MGLTGLQMATHVGSSGIGRTGGRCPRCSRRRRSRPCSGSSCCLIPLAAFFSAVCVSLAVLARSMKEGQYYMTPLYLVCLPLVFLTLAPGVELNLFYSLVPITGVALLLRALILGNYDLAFRYFLPVMVPTLVYAAVALRWAIDQFQREDVLFREAERFSLLVWLRHLLPRSRADADRRPGDAVLRLDPDVVVVPDAVPGVPEGTRNAGHGGGRPAFILIPPLLMAILLTSSPWRTLRLAWPRSRYLFLGLALPFTLNPLVNELQPIVEWLFPISSTIKEALGQLMGKRRA